MRERRVCGDSGNGDMLGIVTSLVDKSLLRRLDEDGGAGTDEPAFRMLTTIREYAAELLDGSDDAHSTRERHLKWVLDLATRAEPELIGPDQAQWIRRLDAEHDNVRAALIWALDHYPEVGMRLASKLWRYWATRSLLTEGHTWLNRFLNAPFDADDAVRGTAFGSLGNLSIDLGDYPGATSAYLQALAIWERLGDTRGIANTLNGLGLVDWYQGEYESARTRHERSLELRRGFGDLFGQANSLTNLGNVIKDLGDVATARDLHEQALAIRQSLGDLAGVGYSYINLADSARRTGDHTGARTMYGKSLEAFCNVGDTLGLGYALHGLGLANYLAGDILTATRHFADALLIRSGLGDRRGMIECIEGIASIAAGSGTETKPAAATLFGASQSLREQIGAPLPEPDRQLYQPIVAGLRQELRGEAFAHPWATGTRLSLSEAVTMATEVAQTMASQPSPEPVSGPSRSVLSEREIEVVTLVASGLTNSQVADRLFLSRRTVDAHLRRIYDKLELSSRAEVIRYAMEHGLA
jgi:non-specific serine/threonine protein kinase